MGKPSPHGALGIDGRPPAPAPGLPPLELPPPEPPLDAELFVPLPVVVLGDAPVSRSDDGDAYVGADTHRDHVFRHLFAGAHAGVETLGDDVGEAVIEEDLDFDVWILP